MVRDRDGSAAARTLWTEEPFRLLVESVRDYAIFMLDPRGVVETWNVGAERIKGYRADEIIGQHFSRFYPEEDIRAGKPDWELVEAARDGRFEDEGWRLRKDGSRFWANVVITALRDKGGQLVGYAKVTRDLTERRHAEEQRLELEREIAAREAERAARVHAEKLQAELDTTLRSIGDGVIATDSDGRIAMMNPVAEALTGWTEAEARGRPLPEVFRIINEHTRATVTSPVEKVIETGLVVGLANHTLLLAKDGREIPIDDSGAPIRADAAVAGVVLVFRDVSERKQEERRRAFLADATSTLAESLDYEATLAKLARAVVPALADWCAIDMLAADGQPKRLAIAHVDPEKVQLARELEAKYPPQPNAPRGVPAVLRTGRSEIYADIPDALLVEGAVDEEHLRIARSLGLRSAMIVPLAARGRVLGAITFVIAESDRRYGQEDLRLAEELARRCAIAVDNARLYASEQRAREHADIANRAKDEFLAMVSHELRTPLNAILGWTKMMTAAGGSYDDTRRLRALDTIERNAVAMAQLIEDLLDMSRIISGRMRLETQPVDLPRVIDAALDSIKPAADAREIRIVPTIDASIPPIVGDATRLQQVVWNLLSNAVKFTERGGRVDVILGRSGAWAEISVADTGKGIAPRFLPYVFDPFRQEDASYKRSRGGLGLGLAITRQLVELHGGRIEARSEGEGSGATFIVCLPVPAAQSERPSAERRRASERPRTDIECPPQLAGLRVLVVDDEEDAGELVKEILERCRCRVTTAAGVDEALAAMAREVPDLVLSDVGMPDKDGFDLIRAIRALPPARGGDVVAAAVTAYARAEDRRALLKAGYAMQITKPVDPGELVAVLASLTRFVQRDSG